MNISIKVLTLALFACLALNSCSSGSTPTTSPTDTNQPCSGKDPVIRIINKSDADAELRITDSWDNNKEVLFQTIPAGATSEWFSFKSCTGKLVLTYDEYEYKIEYKSYSLCTWRDLTISPEYKVSGKEGNF